MMKVAWRSIARTLTAVAATYFIASWIDGIVTSHLIATGTYESALQTPLLFVSTTSLVMFSAFFVGGMIGTRSFIVAAIFLASLFQLSNLAYWAEWHGQSLQSVLTERWLYFAVVIIFSTLGAALGAHARTALFRRKSAKT